MYSGEECRAFRRRRHPPVICSHAPMLYWLWAKALPRERANCYHTAHSQLDLRGVPDGTRRRGKQSNGRTAVLSTCGRVHAPLSGCRPTARRRLVSSDGGESCKLPASAGVYDFSSNLASGRRNQNVEP